ncbi:MAG: twin-arginine translocase TatA/TatE family subunit [Pirellulaceae bacterium]|nr:twin-arginine translocase TatA/TatE family subunit [Planctomycetales bacterium]
MFNIGMQEMFLLGIVAIVLFGKRLPEVAKSLGGSYREFRKGLNDFQKSFHDAANEATSPVKRTPAKRQADDFDDYDQPTAPRFSLPPRIEDNRGDDQ